MSSEDDTKKMMIAFLGIIISLAIIAGSITYYQIHKPPLSLCQDACGHPGMVRSFDPQNGCVCRE